jgi:uncharacterized protein with HEPN domain
MSRRDDQITLQQIRDYAAEIHAFSAGKTFEDFRADQLLNLALVRLLEVVGEAATRLSPAVRERYSQVP